MIYTCVSCHSRRVTRDSELSWTEKASGIVPVPWHAVIDEDGREPAYCCAACIDEHSGLGKFESVGHDRAELGKCLILYAWSQDSGEDNFMTNESYGYCGMFGRFLLMEDDRGFVTFEEYADTAKAQARFDALYDDGMGADESDAWISCETFGRYHVSFDGKPLHVWENRMGEISERRCVARVRLETMLTGYYPDLWIVNDHGNVTRRDY